MNRKILLCNCSAHFYHSCIFLPLMFIFMYWSIQFIFYGLIFLELWSYTIYLHKQAYCWIKFTVKGSILCPFIKNKALGFILNSVHKTDHFSLTNLLPTVQLFSRFVCPNNLKWQVYWLKCFLFSATEFWQIFITIFITILIDP